MFNNIGRKIKFLAETLAWFGIFLCVITGIIVIARGIQYESSLIGLGICIMMIGPIICWILSWPLYGYGQLIENSDILVYATAKFYTE